MNWRYEEGRIYSKNQGNELMAETTYINAGENIVVINHTYVNPALRGQGVAGKMMEVVAEHFRKNGLRANATCSYAREWFKKNNDKYSDILSDDFE